MPNTPSRFELAGSVQHYAVDRAARTEHIRLEIEIDFERKSLSGTCSTRLRAVRNLRSITFEARDLEVTAVSVDNQPAQFSNSGQQLLIDLPDAFEADRLFNVRVDYSCRPLTGLYFWGPDETHPDRPLQAWTQGQDEDARAWFPCLDAPSQKASTEVIARIPPSMTALSNGELISDLVSDSQRTLHFRLDAPHSPYLVTLAVGEFEGLEIPGGVDAGPALKYFFPPGRAEDALRCVGRTGEMLRLFEKIAGQPYPFPAYSQIFVTEFIFGGMENSSASTLTDTVLHDAKAHLDYSAEPLISHELAHQWFGDLITCRDWPHGWLNEGFATYFELLWKEHSEGVDAFDQARKEDWDAYLDEATQRYTRPIVTRGFHQPIELFDRHLYEKGARVLHELRLRLGDSLFFKGLRNYVQTYQNGVVETIDLARAFENATGHNLDRFFDEYVFSPGHPELKIKVRFDAEEKRLRIEVEQPSSPPRHLPLPVAWVVSDVEKSDVFQVDSTRQVFLIDCPQAPSQVRIDSRNDLLAALEVDKPLNYWITELRAAPVARARSEAAAALRKHPSAQSVKALQDSLSDSFWGVQAASAKSLGTLRTLEARDILLAHIEVAHPKARRAVIAALGEFRKDSRVAEALRTICSRGDASYFVEGEAARSLGKLRFESDLGFLQPITQQASFMDVVAVGAVDGLVESQNPLAYDIVEPLTQYGQPVFVRRAAVIAIAKLADVAQKRTQVARLLTDFLRDPQFRVQMAVFEAIKLLDARELAGPLATTPYRDGRALRAARETIRALQESEPHQKAVADLRNELESLRGETRQLRESLEALKLKK